MAMNRCGVFTAALIVTVFLLHEPAYAYQGATKIYSGYYQVAAKSKGWFGSGKKSTEDAALKDVVCYVKFRCPSSSQNQQPLVMPDELTYVIGFKNQGKAPAANPFSDDKFQAFVLKMFTQDEQEHVLDFQREPERVTDIPKRCPEILNPGESYEQEYHTQDTYIKYLILGTSIRYLTLAHPSQKNKEGYFLNHLSIDGSKSAMMK